MLSQSGTFNLADFKLNKSGMSAKSAPTPQPAGSMQQVIDVQSLEELKMGDDLGAGASGTVKKATHTPSGLFVAVKQIQILEKAKRDQMVVELRIMRTHECPWLVTLHNAFYEDAAVSMVLEFMDGGSLADVITKQGPQTEGSERKLALIAMQMLNGLNYLHRQHHQVHRDLKPANVLINSRGQVKIADFGISSQLDSTNGMCSTFVGTTCYMAPERLNGSNYSYGADIWSFGLIMLEMLLGKFPYPHQENYFRLLSLIMDEEAPSVPESTFSNELAEFVSLCLNKNEIKRPSANDLLKHHWLRKHPTDDMLLSASLEKMML